MKKAFVTILFSAILPLAGFAQSTPYKGTISVTADAPEISDGQATYLAEIDFSTLRLSSAQMVELTPMLTSADGSRQEAFAPVVLMGKQRAHILARDKQLNDFSWEVEPSQMIVLKGRYPRRTQIAVTAPFRKDAKLTIVERTFSNNDKPLQYGSGELSYTHTPDVYEDVPALASAPRQTTQYQTAATQTVQNPPSRPESRISNVSPARTRTESFTAQLSFAQNNTLINRTLGDNAVVLAETDARIRAIQADPSKTITAITVKGFASPEGEAEGNRNLAAERSRTFVNYLGNVHNLRSPGVQITATGVGEDWSGLRDLVEGSTMDDRYRILDALDNYTDIPQRRAALQELNSGVTYAILLNYYSTLRRVEYTVEYTVAE